MLFCEQMCVNYIVNVNKVHGEIGHAHETRHFDHKSIKEVVITEANDAGDLF
jgi:hypothetical protein